MFKNTTHSPKGSKMASKRQIPYSGGVAPPGLFKLNGACRVFVDIRKIVTGVMRMKLR